MKIHDDLPEDRLIIGVMVGQNILTGDYATHCLMEQKFDEIITKKIARDLVNNYKDKVTNHNRQLAKKWQTISESPVLLGLTEEGEFCFVKDGHFKPSVASH